jgi:hypothetical protein
VAAASAGALSVSDAPPGAVVVAGPLQAARSKAKTSSKPMAQPVRYDVDILMKFPPATRNQCGTHFD